MKLLSLINRWFSNNIVFKQGSELKIVKQFSQEEVNKFCKLTGDSNPVHTENRSIEQRCVPGAFLNAVIAGLIGDRFPGHETLVIEQKLIFPKQCRINTNTEISLKVLQHRKISIVLFSCKQDDVEVFKGEAKLLIKND